MGVKGLHKVLTIKQFKEIMEFSKSMIIIIGKVTRYKLTVISILNLKLQRSMTTIIRQFKLHLETTMSLRIMSLEKVHM